MEKKQSIFFITGIAALGGFLFGFDMAVVSGITFFYAKQKLVETKGKSLEKIEQELMR